MQVIICFSNIRHKEQKQSLRNGSQNSSIIMIETMNRLLVQKFIGDNRRDVEERIPDPKQLPFSVIMGKNRMGKRSQMYIVLSFICWHCLATVRRARFFFARSVGYAIRDYACHIIGPIRRHTENNGRDDRINYSA